MSSVSLITSKPVTKAATRRHEMVDNLWPGARPHLWHRTREDGYSSVPRTLPLIMSLIDDLGHGKDASRVYFDLWCRQMDDCYVEVTDEETFAYSSDYYTPGRNVRSWRERVDILQNLGFVSVEPNGSRKYGHILLRHPHAVIRTLHEANKIPANWWGAFTKRATEVGASLI